VSDKLNVVCVSAIEIIKINDSQSCTSVADGCQQLLVSCKVGQY
jgi:hypothetical protein